jgi:hypothetical protein
MAAGDPHAGAAVTTFFVPDDGGWRATESTRGPWSPVHQHGGPPAGLLARAIEASVDRAAWRIARINVQFLRPIPIDRFDVVVETAREGKKVRVVLARLVDRKGRDVAIADALLVRRADVGVAATYASPPRLSPEVSTPYEFSFFAAPVGYHTAMEARHVEGTWGKGPMTMWMRMRIPLVPGEEPSPLVRVLLAADSGNGVSVALDLAQYTFVNADLTVSLARDLEGEWVLLDAATRFGADGIGLSDTALSDARGLVGRGAQSLIVERRTPT